MALGRLTADRRKNKQVQPCYSATLLHFHHLSQGRLCTALPTGGLGLASLGHFVCGPHRPGVPRESASPPLPLGGLRLCVAHPLDVGDFVGSVEPQEAWSKA